MLDFNHILTNPNLNIQTFIGTAQTTAGAATGEWKTWIKPRGAKFVYMIGVGGGASGGCGNNGTTTSGGGSGGGSGAQSTLMIPAMFLPDVLYIQAGLGGSQPATLASAALAVAGTITYVALEPWNTLSAQLTVLFANAGAVGTAIATSSAGGAATTAAAVATIANMPLAGRGVYQFFAGQIGTAGGSSTTAGIAQTYPTTGLMVQGGAGGGGSSTSGQAGGAITLAGFGDDFPAITGGAAAVTSTPAGSGSGGTMLKMFQYTGGAGGGGSTSTAGGLAGAGGNGAPGCGGGGAGGPNMTVTTLARPGDGGPGFVYIYSW
jgi:hypothetical protein